MAFSSDDLITFIRENKQDDWVNLAREYTKITSRHTQNNHVVEYLSKISGLENTKQVNLRHKFYISNKHIISSLQRREDNIWSARGGYFNHDLGSETDEQKFLEIIGKINKGNSLMDYMKEYWYEGNRSEPCGGSFVTIKEGDPDEVQQVSIYQIRYIERYGNGCKSILFEPEITEILEPDEENQKVEVKRYLYIDEEKIIIILDKAGRITVEDEKINNFKFVPFIFNSTITGIPNIKEDCTKFLNLSPLNDVLQLLDAYLLKNSVKQIHEFLHSYPIFWRYVHQCKHCRGYGTVNETNETCTACGGSGVVIAKKDVSNVVDVFVPEDGEPNITPPAGYITPPVEIIEAMRTELSDLWNQTTFVYWGVVDAVSNPSNPTNRTATEIITDLQPLLNTLNNRTDEAQKHHNAIIKIILRILHPGTYDDMNVLYAYGRGYVVETSDTAFERYLKAKEKGAPQETLNNYLVNYYASVFRTDDVSYERAIKLMKVEPFVHYTLNQIIAFQNITEEDKKAKAYYNEWKMTIDKLNVDEKEAETLRGELYTYVKQKQITNDTNTEAGTV